jgi:hypothetical protein
MEIDFQRETQFRRTFSCLALARKQSIGEFQHEIYRRLAGSFPSGDEGGE